MIELKYVPDDNYSVVVTSKVEPDIDGLAEMFTNFMRGVGYYGYQVVIEPEQVYHTSTSILEGINSEIQIT